MDIQFLREYSSQIFSVSKRSFLLIFILLRIFVIQGQTGPEIFICKDLQLVPLTEYVYMHRSYKMYPFGRYSSNGIVYVVNDKAIMIDTPVTDSLTTQLIHWFLEKDIQFLSVIPTHWHDDCLEGLPAIHKAGIQSLGLNMTIELAVEHGYVPPQTGFSDSLFMDINGSTIECWYLGAGHALDNIVVWLPGERVLFGGCLVKTLSARGLGNTADADVTVWPHTIQKVMASFPDAQIVIPGHGAPGGKELLDHTYNLLTTQ